MCDATLRVDDPVAPAQAVDDAYARDDEQTDGTLVWYEHAITHGMQRICSGAKGSDLLLVFGVIQDDSPQQGAIIAAAIPTSRHGVQVNDDWAAIGIASSARPAAHVVYLPISRRPAVPRPAVPPHCCGVPPHCFVTVNVAGRVT
ncbi:MAG: hypothetical protein SV966_08375 [Actinomycetota bacterium]|nr:hypothetical protein [Actinomycetota bacterium]